MIQNKPGPRKPTYLPSRKTTARSHCRAIFGACASSNPNSNPTITPAGLNVNQVARRAEQAAAREKPPLTPR